MRYRNAVLAVQHLSWLKVMRLGFQLYTRMTLVVKMTTGAWIVLSGRMMLSALVQNMICAISKVAVSTKSAMFPKPFLTRSRSRQFW